MVLKIKDPTAIIGAASAILFALWAAELALRERLSCSALEASSRRANHPTTQARLTTDALNLARQEFVANHRPRVILRYIQGPFENEEGHQFVWVTFVNIGANTATIEAFGADLAKRWADTDDWASPGLDAEPKEISPIVLACGQRHVLHCTGGAAGAAGTRHSPRPPWGRAINARLGRFAPRGSRTRVRGIGGETNALVMPGLDPGIHPSSQ
jgi:hypothetical protein